MSEDAKKDGVSLRSPRYCLEPERHQIRSWANAPLETVVEAIVDCPHSTPSWTEKGIICVRTSDIRPFKLILSDAKFVSSITYEERISRLKPKEGDILYSREGGILGVASQVPANLEVCLAQRLMLIRCINHLLRGDFLTAVLNSEVILSSARALTTGTASPHLNVHDVKSFDVPIPPIEEQEEIIRLVSLMLGVTNRMEEQCKSAKVTLDRVTQSILSRAFRGELVPQNPNDEPASVLLEKVQLIRSQQRSAML
jgi:type I restriction enzyme S subunit